QVWLKLNTSAASQPLLFTSTLQLLIQNVFIAKITCSDPQNLQLTTNNETANMLKPLAACTYLIWDQAGSHKIRVIAEFLNTWERVCVTILGENLSSYDSSEVNKMFLLVMSGCSKVMAMT